jgi:hypothetical protein
MPNTSPAKIIDFPSLNTQPLVNSNSQLNIAVETIDPQRAHQMLSTFQYDKQRAIRSHHVRALARDMKAGKFRLSLLRMVQGSNGNWRLTDGQHRLSAVIESGVATQFMVMYDEAGTDEAVALDYSVVDGGIKRSFKDTCAVYDLPKVLGISSFQVGMASAAVRFIAGGLSSGAASVRSNTLTTQEHYEHMLDWKDEIETFFLCTQGATKRMTHQISRRAVLSVALITLRFCSETAIQFWSRVARNSGLNRGETCHTLAEYLISGRAVDERPHVTAFRVAAAWNAYYQNREITILRATDYAGTPRIHGTPVTGNMLMKVRDLTKSAKSKAEPNS